jgi:hypothetical protein
MGVIMLSILVVGPAETPIASTNAQVEILRAHSIDEAVEKLARNRRIDAILILSAPLACDVVGAIREETSAPPPFFVGSGANPAPSGARRVSEDPAKAIEQVLAEIE